MTNAVGAAAAGGLNQSQMLNNSYQQGFATQNLLGESAGAGNTLNSGGNNTLNNTDGGGGAGGGNRKNLKETNAVFEFAEELDLVDKMAHEEWDIFAGEGHDNQAGGQHRISYGD